MARVSLRYDYLERGPGRVVHNLICGLRNIGHVVTDSFVEHDFEGCLQKIPGMITQVNHRSLIGPNVFVLPSEEKDICKNFKHFVCPSKWVYDKYRNFSELDHATLDIWPSAIDTFTWSPILSNKDDKRKNVLLYVKNRGQNEIEHVSKEMKLFNVNVKILSYGSYSENDLLAACHWADCCILLTGTESQGIAYMQILSCGVPCYVIDKTFWNYNGKYKETPATSVPYFDNRCGVLVEEVFRRSNFEDFVNRIDDFDPRSFIVENFTLEKCANHYFTLLDRSRS